MGRDRWHVSEEKFVRCLVGKTEERDHLEELGLNVKLVSF
jgi:hypothetical protein